MIPARTDAHRRAAFSLIETVIAVAIAGIAFLVLTETFFNVLLTVEDLETKADHQKDLRFVRSQVIRLADREEVERGGRITTLGLGEAEWEAEIEETETVDLFRLFLEIEFENPEGEEPILHSETLALLRPTWSDAIERSSLLEDVRRDIEEQERRRDW